MQLPVCRHFTIYTVGWAKTAFRQRGIAQTRDWRAEGLASPYPVKGFSFGGYRIDDEMLARRLADVLLQPR
jgi:hypothetical protein